MSITELWLTTTLIPGLGDVLTGSALFMFLLALVVAASTENRRFDRDLSVEEATKARKSVKIFLSLAFLLCILRAAFPTESQMLLIAGGNPAINNGELSKMSNNAAIENKPTE